MHILNETIISDSLSIAEVDKFPEELYKQQLDNWLMNDYPFLPWREHLHDQEKEKIKALGENLKDSYKLRVALLQNGELKGWSFGWQESSVSFFMGASAVAPELRRQGLYSQLLKYVFKRTKDMGFQTISSCHILTNNPVIIAKLKAGFIIKGIEVDAVHGTLLRLNYHHNELLNSASRFRVGAAQEPEVRRLLLRE